MFIFGGSMDINFGLVGQAKKALYSVLIDQLNEYFYFDGFKCAVFNKGGCDLSIKLTDEHTVTLSNSLGNLFGEVYASKEGLIECHSFTVLVNQIPISTPSRITINKAILNFESKEIRFSMNLNQLNFSYDIFHKVIGSEIGAIPKISYKTACV